MLITFFVFIISALQCIALVQNNLIRIGTRGSPLALVQANYVKQLLTNKYPSMKIQIKEIMTKGDSILNQVSYCIQNVQRIISFFRHYMKLEGKGCL